MSEVLILLLGESAAAPVRWAFLGPDGIRDADTAEGPDALAALAGRAADADLVAAVLPGEQVAMRVMPAPPRVTSKFKAAAMYLLEDELAESLETLHISVVRREDRGCAFAVKTSLMDEWRDFFDVSGVHPDIMTADFALLDRGASEGVIVFQPRRIVCAANDQGFAIERPLADGVAAMLVESDTVESVTAFGDAETERFDAGEKPMTWSGGAGDVTLISLYTEGVLRGDAVNLLQGAYRKRRDWRGAVAPWRRAAMLAAACLVGLVTATVADAARSSRLADRLDREALSIHREAFPEAANIDPRDHARQVLSTRTAGPAFLSLTAEIAESVDDDGRVQIDRIRYNAARNEFAVNLSFSDINDLETLKSQLGARGIAVREAGGVRRSGSRYIGELQVTTP